MTLFQLLRLLPESVAYIIVDQQGIEICRGKLKSNIPYDLFEYNLVILQPCMVRFDDGLMSGFCIQIYT